MALVIFYFSSSVMVFCLAVALGRVLSALWAWAQSTLGVGPCYGRPHDWRFDPEYGPEGLKTCARCNLWWEMTK